MDSARETINNIMNERGFRHKHQVADYFGVSPQALSIWIAKNQIPPKHLLKISQEKNSQQVERRTPDGLSVASGSKEELQSVINYLMRENNKLKINSLLYSSMLPDGSSAMISFGLLITALKIDTLCFSPPDNIIGY